MRINLVSEDRDLHDLCQEVLADIGGHHTLSANAGQALGCDVYIWDLDSSACFHLGPNGDRSRHLFVVDRKNLVRFQQRDIAANESQILLKPVTHATLTAFLSLVVNSENATALRADRDEILQCLIQANLKLQEYDQDRTNFLARAMHDFRAPLTALSGYCGLLLAEPLGRLTTDQREVLQRMHHSAQRLSRMASAMFQLSIGRQVKRRPEFQKGSIRDCVDQALHEVTPFIDEKSIEVSVNVQEPDGQLYFEPGQIEQVLINILDNACKFGPRAGLIEVRGYPYFWERRKCHSATFFPAERRKNGINLLNAYRIDIQDSGAPIPPNRLNSIFQEYTSYTPNGGHRGGGLGLAVCRLIMSQHEGTVWAENTENGPMFSVVLPVHSVEPVYPKEYIFAEED